MAFTLNRKSIQPFFVRKTRTVGTMKQKIWYTLDDPASSSIAKGVAFFDLVGLK